MLGVPCIHLDHIYWQPGWREPSPEDFRSRVFAALEEAPRGWVADGRYSRLLGSKVTDDATDLICGKRRRIGGWGGELAAWKQEVEEMIRFSGLDVNSN
ncbi:hypothetical protein GSI_06361 [Ganoderma sinense ZZ0214-1]|uniref:Uncharacterized protein n=1 Tax=Ganoderma sinense ZZ0214-1 TaxID=1077348 RepID=A0A2G8SD21_9APHY|nr:hypothetical protein GSI_06361 [Ganoderma sinense ZZ0214-1]